MLLFGSFDVIQSAIAFGLATARAMGLLIFFPLFTAMSFDGVLRFAVAGAISAPLMLKLLGTPIASGFESIGVVGVLLLKEIMVGAIIGLLTGLPFWAMLAAGDIIDVYRGANATNTTDPINANETSPTGQLFFLASLTIFVILGGIKSIIGLLYSSYIIWPIEALFPPAGAFQWQSFAGLLRDILRTGMLLAGPMLTLLIIVAITMAASSLFSKKMDLESTTNSVKNCMYFLQ